MKHELVNAYYHDRDAGLAILVILHKPSWIEKNLLRIKPEEIRYIGQHLHWRQYKTRKLVNSSMSQFLRNCWMNTIVKGS